MKETRFIAQNKEKWLESEQLLREERKDPGKLSNLFTQVIDDLSYSRTYYPHRSVRVYLNKIARQYFSIIYDNQREKKGRFRLFWMDELPQVIIHCRVPLLISLVVFLLSVSIGVFSSYKDPSFTGSILGPGYVEMTKENIANGDPMAVYKKGHQVDMFLGITLNNLLVAFRTYLTGIFLSVGTIAILLYNGIMVGCFQFFFIQRGLFVESALSIWLHGTLEISSIIISGGAGITLGSGLIFPGTYSRFQAFQISGIRSLKLMLGITPIIITAGIIESFLTRYTETPGIIKLLLILLSAVFILGYFVIYPWWKSRKGFEVPLTETKLSSPSETPSDIHIIKTNADVLKDAFLFYKAHFSKILPWVFSATLIASICDMILDNRSRNYRSADEWWVTFMEGLFYSMKTPDVWYVLINTVASSIIIYRVYSLLTQSKSHSKKYNPILQGLLIGFLLSSLYFLLWFLGGWGTLVVILIFMFILTATFIVIERSKDPFNALQESLRLNTSNFGQVLGLQFTLLLTITSFLLILSAPLIYLYIKLLQWNFAKTDLWIGQVVFFIEIFVKTFAFNMVIPIMALGAAYQYFSSKEILNATHLQKMISLVAGKYTKKNSR